MTHLCCLLTCCCCFVGEDRHRRDPVCVLKVWPFGCTFALAPIVNPEQWFLHLITILTIVLAFPCWNMHAIDLCMWERFDLYNICVLMDSFVVNLWVHVMFVILSNLCRGSFQDVCTLSFHRDFSLPFIPWIPFYFHVLFDNLYTINLPILIWRHWMQWNRTVSSELVIDLLLLHYVTFET